MIISENHFGKENCVAYCDVLIRRNYEVINADEHFYHFVEKLVGINFLDIVHQDNLKDFKMAFETLKPGENCRMLILLRNGIGEYYWTDMVIYNNGKILSGENVIEVRCYFLSAVESRYLMALDNVNKYRTILSTYRIICLITILIRICLQYICTVVISAMHLLRELWNSLGKEC